jgi:hypothetical protein
MEKSEYHRYLASRAWMLLRRQVRARSHGMCERCRERPHQETHHLTYERVGDELLEDLLGVCRPCHRYLSAVTDVDPLESPIRTAAPIQQQWHVCEHGEHEGRLTAPQWIVCTNEKFKGGLQPLPTGLIPAEHVASAPPGTHFYRHALIGCGCGVEHLHAGPGGWLRPKPLQRLQHPQFS